MSLTLTTTPSIQPFGAIASRLTQRGQGGRQTRSGAQHRTGAPVLRNSLEEGTFEETFFSVPAKGETDKMYDLARRALDEKRRLRRKEHRGQALTVTERAIAGVTAAAVRIFEEICDLARLNGGKVFPSYDYLMEKTAFGRPTIARALSALEKAGFLIRQRRFKRVTAEGPGPRYEQTSNVYRPLLPTKLLFLLPRWRRPSPLPVDEVQREADRQDDQQHMLGQLTCRELARVTLSGRMADVFARLGGRIDDHERELRNGPEPLTDSTI